jgi:hypothetical protein
MSLGFTANYLLMTATDAMKRNEFQVGGPVGGQVFTWGGTGPPGPPVEPPLYILIIVTKKN